jgi:COMPASS component SWD3
LKEDKNIFFSGGWDSTIQVWDVRMKEESVRKIYGPTISADSLDFKNGQILAGNYQNKDILQLWDFKSGELIETLDINEPSNGNSYCFAASFAHKSQQNLIGCALSGSNKVKVLKDNKLAT